MINKYIDSKRGSWAESTLRAEYHRLIALKDHINGDPLKLLEALKKLAPYTRVTAYVRVTDYYQFLIDSGEVNGKNEYREYKKKNKKKFTGQYTRRLPAISFEEATRRIESIVDPQVRSAANTILRNGLRFSEVGTISNGEVVGKGNKRRRIYGTEQANSLPYFKLHRALSAIGIRIHDLRKLFLSKIVDNGANVFELCEIAGWANLNTANSYIKTNPSRLKSLVDSI